MNPIGDSAHIGITVPDDHPVFSVVGDKLSNHGHEVSYFDPNEPIDPDELASLSLLVSKRTREESVRAVIQAEQLGVPTWNSATGVVACVSRFSQLCLLSGVGFDVPAASRSKPSGDYVAKRLFHWDMSPEVNGDGDIYEELLPAEPIDFKYYVVHDGSAYRTTVLRATSKLWDAKRVLGETDPVPEHVDRITALMKRLDMRGVGVDLIRTDEGWYAVDLNPCPSFKQTGLEDALVDSIESCLD